MKDEENAADGWKVCKLIVAEENGELKINHDNLQKLLSIIDKREYENVPIELVSFLGPPASGKTFYTNVLAAYLKANGRKTWATTIKSEGLFGFELRTKKKQPLSDTNPTTAVENGLARCDDGKQEIASGSVSTPDAKAKADEIIIIQTHYTRLMDSIRMLVKKRGKSESCFPTLQTVINELDEGIAKLIQELVSIIEMELKPNDSTVKSLGDEQETGKMDGTENSQNTITTTIKDCTQAHEVKNGDNKMNPATRTLNGNESAALGCTPSDSDNENGTSDKSAAHEFIDIDGNVTNKTTSEKESEVFGGLVRSPSGEISKSHIKERRNSGKNIEIKPASDSVRTDAFPNVTGREVENTKKTFKRSRSCDEDTTPMGEKLLGPENDCSPRRILRSGKKYIGTTETTLAEHTLKRGSRETSETKICTNENSPPFIKPHLKEKSNKLNERASNQNVKPDIPPKKFDYPQRDSMSQRKFLNSTSTKNHIVKSRIKSLLQKFTTKGEDTRKNLQPPTIFCPDENASGIYFWPELIPMDVCGALKLFWIMHIHITESDQFNVSQSVHPLHALNAFMAVTSSKLVDIRRSNLSLFDSIKDHLSGANPDSPLLREICSHVTQLHVRHSNEEEVNDTMEKEDDEPPNNIMPYYTTGNDIKISAEGHPTANLSAKQCRNLEAMMKHLTNNVVNGDMTVTRECQSITKISQYLGYRASKVNAFFGFKEEIPAGPAKTQSTVEQQVQPLLLSPVKEKILAKTLPPGDDLEPPRRSSIDANNPGMITNNALHPLSQEYLSTGAIERVKVKDDYTEIPEVQISDDDINSIFEILQNKFKKNLEKWIETRLRKENVSSIPLLMGCLKIPEDMDKWEEIGLEKCFFEKRESILKMVTHKANNELQPILLAVTSALEKFVEKCHMYYDKPSHTTDSLKEILKPAFQSSLNDTNNPEVARFVKLGCIQLQMEFKLETERKRTREGILQDIVKEIRSFYKKTMTKYMASSNFLNPSHLQRYHHDIAARLEAVFKNMGTNDDGLIQNIPDLLSHLADDFKDFNADNMSKLNKFQKKIKDLIEKRKDEYRREMELILNKNPNGIKSEDLNRCHEKKLQEATDTFCRNLAENVANDEPIEAHVAVLQGQIKKLYTLVEKQNQKKVDEKKMKEEKIALDKRPSENEKPANNASIGSEPMIQDSITISENQPDQPLFLKLTLQNITFALPKEGNCFASNNISTDVGLSLEEEWLCGQELIAIQSQNLQTLRKYWKLAECWQNPKGQGTAWQDVIVLEGKSFTVTTEFLLGILFLFIKNEIEVDIKGKFSRVLISVPFWFTSCQRQQILDVTALAGYSNVHLVNENSASAYFAYGSGQHNFFCDTVVISENSLKVDISLYSFDSHSQKLSMIAHVGDYEPTQTAAGGYFINTLFDLLRSLLGNNVYDGEESYNVAALESKLMDLWKLALDRAERQRPGVTKNPRKVLICCETDYWRNLLWKLAASISDIQLISVRNDSSILGMYLLHQISSGDNFVGESLLDEKISIDVLLDSTSCIKPGQSRKVNKFGGILFTFKVPYKYQQINAVQNVLGVKKIVGSLSFHSSLSASYQDVEITLEQSTDGKIICREVKGILKKHKLSMYGYSPSSQILYDTKDYIWEAAGVTPTQASRYKSALSCVNICNSAKKKQLALQIEKAVHMATALKTSINNGVVKFRREVIREATLRQIEIAMTTIQARGTCAEKVTTQVEIVQNLVAKYIVT